MPSSSPLPSVREFLSRAKDSACDAVRAPVRDFHAVVGSQRSPMEVGVTAASVGVLAIMCPWALVVVGGLRLLDGALNTEPAAAVAPTEAVGGSAAPAPAAS